MSSSHIHHILLLLVALVAAPSAYAQFPSIPFTILDAEDRNLTDELGHIWDPEDGIWMPSTLSLPERNGLEVFVTHEVCADSIVTWSKSNRQQHRNLVSEFVNEYRQRGWLLLRHGGSYNLADINAIAEDIYAQYPSVIDYWNEASRDTRGKYAMALVLHPQEGGPFESVILNEKVVKYDGDEELCPVYYKNRVMLSNVTTISRRPHFRRVRGSATSDATTITFLENFHIEGPSSRRLVIDRLISTCNFETDLKVLRSDFHSSEGYQDRVSALFDHGANGDVQTYRLRPFVFAGEEFQLQLSRRLRDHLLRDSLEHYRLDTREQMNSLLNWVEYREVEPDTMTYLVPQALWKLVLRYRNFDNLRDRLRKASPSLPLTVAKSDTVHAYYAITPTSLFKEFQAYVDSGHAMADHYPLTSERDLREGYISRLNQLDLYPLRNQSRRLRIEHRATDSLSRAPEPIMLSSHPVDTMFYHRWTMPDPTRFYQLRHVNYLQDFTHADTASVEECGCDREMPLQFLNLSVNPAGFDCPPRQNIATSKLVSFKPRARGELTDATYHLSLVFDRNRSELDLNLGNNRAQMDSLVMKAYQITNDLDSRIQQVGIVGISSPEGTRNLNLYLSRARSENIIQNLRTMGGAPLARASFRIVRDSIAPWTAVADLIEAEMPEHASTAQHIRRSIQGLSPNATKTMQERIGYSLQHNDPVIDNALKRLREVQVTYSYKAVMEATEQMIIERFRRASNIDNFPPDYYYWILTSSLTTAEEKSRVAHALLKARATDVRRFCVDLNPTNSYGLVLPIAANIIASEGMRQGHFDREILAPFIDRTLYQGNVACYMSNDLETPVKFINLDVILFNQIVMLTNIGTPDAIEEAYDLMDILNETPTLSEQFRSKYRPEQLEFMLDSQGGRFRSDPRLLSAMRQSSLRNLYVVNLADIYSRCNGDIVTLQSDSEASLRLTQCADSLQQLRATYPDQPAMWYFTAVTNLWQSASFGTLDKNDYCDLAVDALYHLFLADQLYISRLQGDSYVRHHYRNAAARQLKRDLYLEAVERYISHTTF